ncbi:hypothetical protein ES708_33037 [subsurface metagenome]
MQYGRYAHRLADLGQPFTGKLLGGFGHQQPGLGTGNGVTAGGNHQHVVLYQLFNHGDMAFVMLGAGVIAADDAGKASYPSVDDVIVQRAVGSAEHPAQQVVDGLVAETGNLVGLVVGDMDVPLAVGEVFDSRFHYFPRRLQGIVLVELDMGSARNPGFGRGGDNLGVVTFGDGLYGLHNALYIHHHGVHRAGDYSQLLLQEITGDGHSMPHQYLVGGAAHPGKVYSLGPLGLGQLYHLRLLGDGDNHLGKQRLMAMNDDIDLALFEHPQISLAQNRCGSAEEYVLEIGSHQAAAPPVG